MTHLIGISGYVQAQEGTSDLPGSLRGTFTKDGHVQY